MEAVADAIDFVIVHSYPGGATADEALDRVGRLPGQLREVRRQIDRYAGERSAEIGIALTEVNSNVQQNSRPNGLFAADAYMTALENGVFNVDWWNTHNGPTEVNRVDGELDFNDAGLLSSGGCVGDVCQPPLHTPFHPYYGIKSLTRRPGRHHGGRDLQQRPGLGPRRAPGRRRPRRHADQRGPGPLLSGGDRHAGFSPGSGTPVVHRYARGDTDVTRIPTPEDGSHVLPPYSITTVTVSPAPGGASVGAPGRPRVTAVDSTTATVSWPSTQGSPVRYEVYERLGANAQLLATSTSTSAPLRNLPPGSEHTVNVLARDADGRHSRPSEPLTLTTTSPRDSGCLVTYRVDGNWSSGFVASVTVSNLGDRDQRVEPGLLLALRRPVRPERLERAGQQRRAAGARHRRRRERGPGPRRRFLRHLRLRRGQRRGQPDAHGLHPQRHGLQHPPEQEERSHGHLIPPTSRARGTASRTLLAGLVTATLLLTPWSTPTAVAHDSVADPLSRVYGCHLRWGGDWMNPDMEREDPMCWQAWQAPTGAMWLWNALYREGTGGDYRAFIPDNQLCSAGLTDNGRYAPMDTPGPWRSSQVDSTFTVDVFDEARHGADCLEVYVTRQGYDAEADALDWADLELVAETGRYAPASHYTAEVGAPGRSGHHVVYTIWKASHGDQIYFMCSDVPF